ncbi:hypothetical protein BFJ69_g2348 [Fusarium oxysporum]|uniref:RING-type domain-containing protein n=1 Tax=Fusarium oxysporum TaxID=5507 RepID=A0A420NV07_FUSOX|nr:hypothetical protein BFJ69_g2348 [Fusarium oxysporum]
MFPFKNIFQRLKRLSVPKFPTKEAQPHPFASSQTLEFITKAEGIVTGSFWPNIRKHILADDPNAKPMKAICAIFWDELHVTSPCGHIMCPKCWPRQVFDYYAVDFVAKRKCPVCQTELECFLCEETCNKEMIPTYGGNVSIESFPETAPECGREYCLAPIFLQNFTLLLDEILLQFDGSGQWITGSSVELWQILTRVATSNPGKEITCLIDAVNECNENERNQFLKAEMKHDMVDFHNGKRERDDAENKESQVIHKAVVAQQHPLIELTATSTTLITC